MGEAQVQSAAVDVEHAVQIPVAHGRAFDVPAGAAHAERRRPARVLRVGGLRRLPQREIARIVLVGGCVGGVDRIVLVVAGRIHGRAHAVSHGGGLVGLGGTLLLMGQLAVMRPARHVEIHVAGRLAIRVINYVAVTVVDDAADQVDHVDHVPGRAGLIRRRQHAKCVIRLRELPLVEVRARPPLLACRGRLVEDFVVDIGHVAHERDLISQPQHPSPHHIERDGRSDMADVRGALHGGAAHVDPHLAGLDRGETRDRVRSRVIQLQTGRGARHAGVLGSIGILRF